ncbi:putative methylenetetrahydrofolate reductase [Gloeomargarita lithophora Alchichica-D10]|uniref:Methylenetetrahydrofolate reductase n=1 Tax=Gloeomargarita lithophora Alchichica-D10 TaxID=1188229 RepID=A0A1J0AGC0_9CYAN|nr:methylenetetrahydrofolate reductase [Gloeomargarita lithophora]APB34988.1 putative methylenetetrahydrofolate reductase [Gloeomargarita lithophora Alchichica-D10]
MNNPCPPLSRLQQGIHRGEFLITAEVMPPKGGNPAQMLQMAQLLHPWVHGINVTDGSRAVLRMSSLAAASLLQQHHLEPIYQLACRDRNRIALQADLLGAHGLGIRNVLALTGDPVKAGDQPKAKAVFEYESVRLLQVIQKLNQGGDSENQPLPDGALTLFPGAAVDPQSGSWSGLQSRFERKLQAGAQFFQSQMIVDFDRLEKFMTQIAQGCGRPILAGIFLLKSAKNAHYINKYVPGVQIPEALIQRLEQAEQPLETGITIASEQVQWAQHLCQGVHLMAVKREDLIPEILTRAGLSSTIPAPYTPPAPPDPRVHGAKPAGEIPEK